MRRTEATLLSAPDMSFSAVARLRGMGFRVIRPNDLTWTTRPARIRRGATSCRRAERAGRLRAHARERLAVRTWRQGAAPQAPDPGGDVRRPGRNALYVPR